MQQLADLLEAQTDALLKRWIDQVGASLAPGSRTEAELVDHIPAFLRQVIAALREPASGGDASPVHAQSSAGRAHGAQRFRLGFELEAVVREYGLLLHLVLDLVESAETIVPIREVRRLNDVVTSAVAEATAEYARRLAATSSMSTFRKTEQLRAQLETTLLSMGDGVLATDAEGRITLLNPAAEILTGWRASEAFGQPAEEVLRLVHAVTRDVVPSPLAAVLRGEPATHLGEHVLLVRRDGSKLAFADSLAAVRDDEGAIVGAVLVFRDETETRRKDAELRIFRAVVDASTDFISFGRPGGRPEYVNPAGLRLVGLENLEAARALDVGDYYTPESREATIARLLPVVRAGGSFHGQTELRHFVTGEPIPVSQAAFAVCDASGRPVLLAAVLRDRRDQQRAEAEREQLLADAQAARREADLQRERLASVFTQAPVGVAILHGADNVVVLANDAICRIWGVTHEAVINHGIFELLVDAKEQGFPALLAEVRRTGTPFVGRELGITVPRLDGSTEDIVVNFVYQPIIEADGSVGDIIVVATEVTVEVQARRAAEAISAEFEAMFNSLPDGAFLVRPTGIQRANQAGLTLLGVDRIEALQHPPDELSHILGVREAFTDEIGVPGRASSARALKGEVVREEYTLRNVKTGEDVRVRTIASPIRVGGAITGAVVMHTDITKQHRALQALHHSEQSFRSLAEAIPQQVWTATIDGAVDFVNQRFLDYFASTQEQILAAGWQTVVHPDDLTVSLDRWAHSIATGEEYEVELRLRRADGAYRWHLGRARASRDAHGGIIKWFGTNTDIDEAKKGREDLEKRTQFEQHLLGIVSHDLRNPLAAIVLSAMSLLQMKEQSERVTKVARRIHSSAERSSRMISDLLDFTQARLGGGIQLEKHPTDLYTLVSSTLDEVEVAYPERTLELIRSGDTRGTWDADRIVQVVTNLVTNALKYSTPDTPVTVRAIGLDGTVELSVHNECPPIPKERMSLLFEPLQRASDQIDRKTRSVGLGLYIVDAIVKAHSGSVGVVSTEEAGTTFTVRLPREAVSRGSSPGERSGGQV